MCTSEFLDPDSMEQKQREEARDVALNFLRDVVDSAEVDTTTGEVILWGRWGQQEAIQEERFQSAADIQDFLESFGWKVVDDKKGCGIQIEPHAEHPVLDLFDSDHLVVQLIREHGLKKILADAKEFSPDRKLFEFRQLSRTPLVNDTKIELIAANDELIRYLAAHPSLMHELKPRKFEELVAEIFKSLGFEVILTPRTRDGGFDVRAVSNSSLGTLLYLIECKKYAPDRPVGIELVRSLYGTVMSQRASHGILATTSYFSKDAKQLASSLQYQLSLSDYQNLKTWLQEYKISADPRIR
jgi:hypothetical protein